MFIASQTNRRTVVVTDLHGDLDILLQSLAAKGVVRYAGNFASILQLLESAARPNCFIAALENDVIPQDSPLLLVFLGDMLDRWCKGYHLIRYLCAIRWEQFAIEPVFILGNHDIHNFQFFVNPFKAHETHQETGHDIGDIVHFISDIGLAASLESFMDLHGAEIRHIQEGFYRDGVLDWDLGYASMRLHYGRDLTPLLTYRGTTWADLDSFYRELAAGFGFSHLLPPRDADPTAAFFRGLQAYCDPQNSINFWDINPVSEDGSVLAEYDSKIGRFNIFREKPDPKNHRAFYLDFRAVLPVDWRVISLVWRRHYGNYFRRTQQMYLEGATIFAHGGISPRVLIDSQSLGLLYQVGKDSFLTCSSEEQPLSKVIDRANRLARQVIENALNDFSFRCMSGTELTDLIGSWRGGRRGFTQFGGVYWSDYNHLEVSLQDNARLCALYEDFMRATGIRRVICGHTRFQDEQPERRYRQIQKLHDLGMEYICLDNGCSRGYRVDPILNGIEIDREGFILDPGGVPISTA